jgi:glycosyltransferase involved in cell wall biosynthesis
MNLLFDGHALRFPRTGIVNYCYAVAKEYRKRLGYDCFKILVLDQNVSSPEIKEFLKGCDVAEIFSNFREGSIQKIVRRMRGGLFANYLPGLEQAINNAGKGFDVYHGTDWYLHPVRSAKINALTMFDLTTTLFPEFHEPLNIDKERTKLGNLQKFDYIFCISENTKQDLLGLLDLDPEKLILNPIGVDPVFENPCLSDRNLLETKYNIPRDLPYFLSVSTIEPRKNFMGVLGAFQHFIELNPSLPHILVCSGLWGWKNDELRDYIQYHNLSERVRFTGYTELEDLPTLYNHATGFIYLSFYEGFGLPILEAMKSRCPVICSNTSSMPEVIGDAGILVSPSDQRAVADALARVVLQPEHVVDLVDAAFIQSDRFSWERHVNLIHETFANALSG